MAKSKDKKDKDKVIQQNGKTKTIRLVDEKTKSLRRLYNRLMQKPKDQKAINKSEIVKNIIKHIDRNYIELCFKHDGCRILQGSIKYGDKTQRNEIIASLLPQVYQLIIGKYSIFLAVKMFKYGSTQEKEKIINDSLLPNFKKILKNANGIQFMKAVFGYSSSSMQEKLVEFYMQNSLGIPFETLKKLGEINLHKEDSSTSENVIIQQQENFDYDKVREKLKSHLEKQLESGIHKNYLFQAFLNKTFTVVDLKTKSYISELFDDDLLPFIDNHHGIELCCKLYTVANAKTRKKVIKKLKDSMNDLLTTEHSSLFLIKMILFTDDTKLLEKYILKFLLEKLNEEFTRNKIIFKVISNIFSPFNLRANKPHEVKILMYSEESSNKKDLSKRKEEICELMIDDVLKLVNMELKFVLTDPHYSFFIIDLIHYLDQAKSSSKLKALLENITAVLVDNAILENITGQLVIKRILKDLYSKDDTDSTEDNGIHAFARAIAKILVSNLEQFLHTKAIFLIIQLVETKKTKKLIEKHLKKHRQLIAEKAQDQSLKGFQILNKILQ